MIHVTISKINAWQTLLDEVFGSLRGTAYMEEPDRFWQNGRRNERIEYTNRWPGK